MQQIGVLYAVAMGFPHSRATWERTLKYNDDAMTVHVHQSDIKDWLGCGHQAFLKKQVHTGRFETDAATCGTVLHKVIETELDEGMFYDEQDCVRFGLQYFLELLETYVAEGSTYSRSSHGTDQKAITVIDRLCRSWYRSDDRIELLGMEDGALLPEWDFDVPLGIRVGGRDVYVTGQSDLLVVGHKVIDWKTASQSYKRWEKQRWDVQPTVYTYAAHYEGLLVPNKFGEFVFEYHVFDTKGSTVGPPEIIGVKRSPANWDWLKVQITNMLMVMEALPEGPWPMDDTHVLCSPKWCPVWEHCKGQVVSGETWT